MLVLTRCVGERIMIGNDIVVTVLAVDWDSVAFGVEMNPGNRAVVKASEQSQNGKKGAVPK